MELNVKPLKIEPQQYEKELSRYRKELGEAIIAQRILDTSIPVEYTSTFDGYGDSGQYNHEAGQDEVDTLFSHMIDTVVTFDWYNGDGGGGDITWDVLSDVITINGYANTVTQEDMMSGETF